jgi:hypothetical protein
MTCADFEKALPMHGPSGSFRPGHQWVAHCGQCTAIMVVLVAYNVYNLISAFVTFVTSQHNAHNIYLFMFKDNPLLTGSCIWQQPRLVMIQVNSLFIDMHSDDEGWDDQTTSGY